MTNKYRGLYSPCPVQILTPSSVLYIVRRCSLANRAEGRSVSIANVLTYLSCSAFSQAKCKYKSILFLTKLVLCSLMRFSWCIFVQDASFNLLSQAFAGVCKARLNKTVSDHNGEWNIDHESVILGRVFSRIGGSTGKEYRLAESKL